MREFAAKKITTAAGNFIATYFHEGAWEIKHDEQAAVLQKGEMVIPTTIADDIRGSETFQAFTSAAADKVKDWFGIGNDAMHRDLEA